MKAKHGELHLLALVGSVLEIDAEGRVWRIGKEINGCLYPCARHRAEFAHPQGYLRVRVRTGGAHRAAVAHRLVWVAAHGAIPDGIEINHRDGNKANNALANLELATPSQNVLHSLAVLGRKRARGERHHHAKYTEADVREMRRLFDGGLRACDVAARVGAPPSTVERIVNRRTWRHVQ